MSPQLTWIGWSHNPEVAGSNPAPATEIGPQARALNFVPLFVPIAILRGTDLSGNEACLVARMDGGGAAQWCLAPRRSADLRERPNGADVRCGSSGRLEPLPGPAASFGAGQR